MKRSEFIFTRMFGVKPGPTAPKLERLLWFRRYYLRNLALLALGVVVVLIFLPPWIIVIVVAPWVFGFARLNLEIRRERGS